MSGGLEGGMLTALAIAIGALYAAGIYLVLRRSVAKLVFGLAILTTAANLLIFTAARLVRGRPPIVPPDAAAVPAPHADPVAQALILTAIVVGFGAVAFGVALIRRVHHSHGADDFDELRGES